MSCGCGLWVSAIFLASFCVVRSLLRRQHGGATRFHVPRPWSSGVLGLGAHAMPQTLAHTPWAFRRELSHAHEVQVELKHHIVHVLHHLLALQISSCAQCRVPASATMMRTAAAHTRPATLPPALVCVVLDGVGPRVTSLSWCQCRVMGALWTLAARAARGLWTR